MSYLLKYFNWNIPKPTPSSCIAEMGIIVNCDFEFTIWHNKPCMGECGPNPGNGSPVCLKQLNGNEKYFL